MPRARAYSGLTPPPLTCASASATACTARPTPSGVQPRSCWRIRSIFHGGAPTSAARAVGRVFEPAVARVVGHAEAGRLGPAPVVAGDGGRVDPAGGVGGELVGGAGQLAQVTADRVEQGADRVRVGLPPDPLELGPHEGGPLA